MQALEEVGAGEEHVAQHLGGHDDHGRPGRSEVSPVRSPTCSSP